MATSLSTYSFYRVLQLANSQIEISIASEMLYEPQSKNDNITRELYNISAKRRHDVIPKKSVIAYYHLKTAK